MFVPLGNVLMKSSVGIDLISRNEYIAQQRVLNNKMSDKLFLPQERPTGLLA